VRLPTLFAPAGQFEITVISETTRALVEGCPHLRDLGATRIKRQPQSFASSFCMT
jgi:hypothetical protein